MPCYLSREMVKSASLDDRPFLKNGNPFEEQWAKKTKNGLVHKKRNRTSIRPGASRTSGRNKFHDQRVGENIPGLTDEDRYIARLQRERSRGSKKKERFNLMDSAERVGESPGLTLRNEEFPMQDPEAWKYFVLKNAKDDYSNEDGFDEPVNGFHFITESRATNNDSSKEMRSTLEGSTCLQPELDESDAESQFPKSHQDIMDEVMSKSKMFKAERQRTKVADEVQREALDGVLQELLTLISESNSTNAGVYKEQVRVPSSDFDYETTLRSLAAEPRAHASSRSKTEDEKEAEERERLEDMEKLRLSRMTYLAEHDSDGDDDLALRHRNKLPNTEDNVIVPGNTTTLFVNVEDVPFIFKSCPADSNELAALLELFSPKLRGVVIERLLKCFAVSLDSANSAKLQRLLVLLLERIHHLCRCAGDLLRVCQEIDGLINGLYALSIKYPNYTIEWSRERVYEAYCLLWNGESHQLSKCWTPSVILLFRVIGLLFPGSDLRHSVITPLMLLCSEGLSTGRQINDRDFALGCFLCAVVLRISASTARTSGQVVQFLCYGLKKFTEPDEVSGPNNETRKWKCSKCGSIVEESNVELCLSDCTDCADCQHVPVKGWSVLRRLITTVLFNGRVVSPDVVYAPLLRNLRDEETRSALRIAFEKHCTARKPLTLYTEKTSVMPKAVNPKFTAVNGVYKKHERCRPGVSSVLQTQNALKRIRKSLRKEERGYARDLRREALMSAQSQTEADARNRVYVDTKTKELRLFLEGQQSTWNKAAKRQNKLSGRKW